MEKVEGTHSPLGDRKVIREESKENDLTCERILNEVGGFGLYQIIIGIATGLALVVSSYDMFNFVFASAIPKHRYPVYLPVQQQKFTHNIQRLLSHILFSLSVFRCWVPECEPSDSTDFNANWTKYAIFDSCSRYAYIPPTGDDSCSEQNFNQSQIIPCNGYIIEDHEERLINHVSSFEFIQSQVNRK